MKKISFEEAIKALEEGKKVYKSDGKAYYERKTYMQYAFNTEDANYNRKIESSPSSWESLYLPEEPKPFEITETGLYKTRGGRKAVVFYIGDASLYCVDYIIMDESGHFACTTTGDTCMDEDKHYDIIGKWENDKC